MRRGKKNTYKGIDYRSLQESNFAKLLEDNKINFLYEPYTFEVFPAFLFMGKKIRPITYTPDFLIEDQVIVEIKGWVKNNPDFPLREKLFKKSLVDYYPQWSYQLVTNITEMEKFIEDYKNGLYILK